MVRYNQAYKGSQHIGYIQKNGDIVKKIYKGSTLIYQLGFDPVTFNAGASLQTFTVPLGITKIHVDCVASKGADAGLSGGNGGRVQCDLNVTGGQTLYIMVGSIPTSYPTATYNASDIRTNNAGILDETSLQSRLVVAGGGGSSTSSNFNANGGAGGGEVGANGGTAGNNEIATGGTQTSGGTRGGTSKSGYGANGTFGLGGNGYAPGGAGGAGWYGGGGGGLWGHNAKRWCTGGGGGSSYADSSLCSNVVHTQGYNNGVGYITISYID